MIGRGELGVIGRGELGMIGRSGARYRQSHDKDMWLHKLLRHDRIRRSRRHIACISQQPSF